MTRSPSLRSAAAGVLSLTLALGALPTATAPARADDAPPASASSTVVTGGDVRLTTSVEHGRLVQKLVADGETRDLGATVLAVPTAEAWSGVAEGEYAESWERLAPEHGDVWRTSADGRGANPLSFVLDSTAIGAGVLWDDDSGLGGRLLTRLGGSAGAGETGLMLNGVELFGMGTNDPTQNPWVHTSDPLGSGWNVAEQPLSFAFTASGRYCTTLQTSTQLIDGTVVGTDVTLTFAVGGVDPASVAPCAQPDPRPASGPAPAVDEGTGTVVVDSGIALFGTRLTEGALSLDLVTDDDRGRTTAFDPSRVVLSVPNQDSRWPWEGRSPVASGYAAWQKLLAEGTRGYRTPGLYAGDGTDERANDLVLDLEARFVDGAQLAADSGIGYQFRGATSSGTGYLAAYRQSDAGGGLYSTEDSTGFWDSRPGGLRNDQTQGPGTTDNPFHTPFAKRGGQGVSALGVVFSTSGVYCATLRSSATLASGEVVSDTATFTFAVGVDAASVTPCAQVPGTDPGTGPGTDPGTGQLDPTVTYYRSGHLDLAMAVGDTGLAPRIFSDAGYPESALRDAVWVGSGEYAQSVVPRPDEFQDLTFIGPPGTPWYGWRVGGSDVQAQTIWPGISLLHLPAGYTERDGTWTLSKVSGPGDVYVWGPGEVFLNSAAETSTSFRLGRSHVHQNWAFTQPGVYCLAVHAALRPTGADADQTGSGLLTVAVGGVDLSTVQPCERSTPTPAPPVADRIDELAGTFATVSRDHPYASLGLAEVAGRIRAVTGIRQTVGRPAQYRDPAGVVFDVGTTGSELKLRWNTLTNTDAVSDDVTVTLGAVTGAGDYIASGTDIGNRRAPDLDSRAGQEKRSLRLWPRHMSNANHTVTANGVTCVPLTFSGTTRTGTPFSVSTTLTLVAGVDAATVTPCANGDGTPPEGPGPGGGGAAPEPGAVWDVRNGTVNSRGATVINDGHVDLASVLEDGRLKTRVKDTATSDDPVWRDIARTVLQLSPSSRATVPAGDAWSFLGAAGSTFYQVTQTQQEGLLWPGWSTESIPVSATTGGVAWALTDVSGPGRFALYETGDFGRPKVLFDSGDGITDADRFTIPKNVHAHGSWAFGAEGNYCLSMQRSAQLADGRAVSDTFVLAVAVGTADVMRVDPARCGEKVSAAPTSLAPPAADGVVGTPAARQLAATQCVAGATILSAGHVDYASRIVDGRLQSLVGDDTSGSKVYREPSGVVLWLKPSAAVTLPSGYGEVGAEGSTVWQVPQTQNADLVWLGWNTESLNSGNAAGPVQWRIDGIEGPGSMTVYLKGAFGGVQQVVFRDGGSYGIPLGVHAHANWAFSAPGVYRVTSTQTVTLADGRRSSDTETLTIAVGDVDPATAVRGATGCGVASAALLAEPPAAAGGSAPAADSGSLLRLDPEAGGSAGEQAADQTPTLLAILGLLLTLGAGGLGVLWWRRRAGA